MTSAPARYAAPPWQAAKGRASFPAWASLAAVLVAALGFRLLFAALTAPTYDYDEFVILLLSRDYAHGAVPYHDFMFFHPPGILALFRALEPLTTYWWPIGRLLILTVDVATAGLVWWIGRMLFGNRAGLIAGLLYAASPLALVSAVRIGQDPLITCLGVAGIGLLLASPSRKSAVAAGICLGLALWIKYPAAIFAPVYFLISPRRTLVWLLSCVLVVVGLFLPFHATWNDIYRETVAFQRTRWLMPQDQRTWTVLIFWVGVNALGIIGATQYRPPLWLATGFVLGGVFGLASQIYYHYFVSIVPMAALLAAPWLASVSRTARAALAGVVVAAALATAAMMDYAGAAPLYVTAAKFSAVAPALNLIERRTPSGSPVLADRLEYAYLASRPALAHYFWNLGVLVNAGYLEARLPGRGAVVMSRGASSGFPAGFTKFLDARWKPTRLRSTTVWLIRSGRRG